MLHIDYCAQNICYQLTIFDVRDRLSAFRVVSVDYSGKLVIWTVLDFQRDYEKNLSLAHWGQVSQQLDYIQLFDFFFLSSLKSKPYKSFM